MPVHIACDAYPDGVPDAILDNEWDHRQPVEGDNGLQFVPIDGFSNEDAEGLFLGL